MEAQPCTNKKQRIDDTHDSWERPTKIEYNVSEHVATTSFVNGHVFQPLSFDNFLEEATLGSLPTMTFSSARRGSKACNSNPDCATTTPENIVTNLSSATSPLYNILDSEETSFGSSNDDQVSSFFKDNDTVEMISTAFKIASLCGIVTWLALVSTVYAITPSDNLRRVNEVEFFTTIGGASIIFISAACKCAPPLVIRSGWISMNNGVVIGALTVQLISFLTDFLPTLVKVPIMVDRITGANVYLLRFCSWTPLAFLMTFFTEVSILSAIPEKQFQTKASYIWRALRVPVLHSCAQSISAFQGLIFPFCKSLTSWIIAMVVSCVCYLTIFARLFYRTKMLRATPRGPSVTDEETYDRARLSCRLLTICASVWTAIALLYFFQSFAPWFVADNSVLKHKSLPLICECSMNVVAKVLYLDVLVNLHYCAFDVGKRAARRLEELKRMMLVVWESSADFIALSVRDKDGVVTSILSPNFVRLGCTKEIQFSIKKECSASMKTASCNKIGLADFSSSCELNTVTCTDSGKPLLSVTELLKECWKQDTSESLLLYDIKLPDGALMPFEGKLTRLKCDALILVLQDISTRKRRLEAENQVLSEKTARIKDEEANRFTRHEVKNGLLASIALCDCLKEAVCSSPDNPIAVDKVKYRFAVQELEAHLQVVYDTVIEVAMARDVIHEVYQPKMEPIDLCQVLPTSFNFRQSKRFTLVTFPSPLPIFMTDPQLIKFIHGNAISNACKYGRKEGVVLTEVHYLNDRGVIQIIVINFPGEDYDEIIAKGQTAEEMVFAPRERLHSNVNSALSSGDGAWISQKCAKALGGKCSIKFFENKTVFTFECPASPLEPLI